MIPYLYAKIKIYWILYRVVVKKTDLMSKSVFN